VFFVYNKIHIENLFGEYKRMLEDETEHSFASFLSEIHKDKVPDEKEIKNAAFGEACDVLGNFLPASTLTSLAVSVSGEELPILLKHLYLDKTPENIALAEIIISEAEHTGATQFIRHMDSTEWEMLGWTYLNPKKFEKGGPGTVRSVMLPEDGYAREVLKDLLSDLISLESLKNIKRSSYDKLPAQFESLSMHARGSMTFRGWRDLQRQQYATHVRTLLSPVLGFYEYDKPAPEWLGEVSERVFQTTKEIYEKMSEAVVPPEMMQYAMPLGVHIGFSISMNFRQAEFCAWQRTKFSVNHEVRRIFIQIEEEMRKKYPWWKEISRADITSSYIFARTKDGIPLE